MTTLAKVSLMYFVKMIYVNVLSAMKYIKHGKLISKAIFSFFKLAELTQ